MKKQGKYGVLILLAVVSGATAQKLENDDMYFTSEDRAKLRANAAVAPVSKAPVRIEDKQTQKVAPESEVALNPTDSYSARNVNPEYSSASGAKNGAPKADYFIEDYTPTGVNGNLNGNYSSNPTNAYANYSNNPYAYSNPYSSFGSMGWGYPMNGMYSPYGMGGYGYPYDPFRYGSGMSMLYGMGFGYNPWMYSSMMYGYGNPYYSTMYDPFMMGTTYCPYSFYGYNSVPYSPNSFVGTVDNQINGRNVVYGRRSERSTSEHYQADDTRPSVNQSRTGRTLSSGRARSPEGAEAYYERGWKNKPSSESSNGSQSSPTRSFWTQKYDAETSENWSRPGRPSTGSSWNSSTNTGSESSWSSGGNTRSSWSGGSSGNSGGGGGGRSSSVGGGGTRGRDN